MSTFRAFLFVTQAEPEPRPEIRLGDAEAKSSTCSDRGLTPDAFDPASSLRNSTAQIPKSLDHPFILAATRDDSFLLKNVEDCLETVLD